MGYLLVGMATCVLVLGAALLAALAAVRDEHMLVLHWSAAGTVFLERGPDGRYEGRQPAEVPFVVARYVAARARSLAAARPRPAASRRHVLFPAHKA